jgi:hypothetical protein
MDPEIAERISASLGRRVTGWHATSGGYTAAERWICALGAGRSAFAKVAVDGRTAQWLREEFQVYMCARTPPPPGLWRLADQKASVFSGWATVARDPQPFLSLGQCSAAWLVA